jgi:hypothetical protein
MTLTVKIPQWENFFIRRSGPKLYSIGTFATGSGTVVLSSDINGDVGYIHLSGIYKGSVYS